MPIMKESSAEVRCEGAFEVREIRNRSPRQRFVAIVALMLGVTAAYVLSFFAMRKHFSVTVDLSFNRLTCCYFSETPIVNKIAYYAYLPCIIASGGVDVATLNRRLAAIGAAQNHKVVYLYEPPNFTD